MKRLTVLMMILLLGSICLGPIGCSNEEPTKKAIEEPTKKTIIEKLNSDNQEEQEQGLREANEKYGGGQ